MSDIFFCVQCGRQCHNKIRHEFNFIFKNKYFCSKGCKNAYEAHQNKDNSSNDTRTTSSRPSPQKVVYVDREVEYVYPNPQKIPPIEDPTINDDRLCNRCVYFRSKDSREKEHRKKFKNKRRLFAAPFQILYLGVIFIVCNYLGVNVKILAIGAIIWFVPVWVLHRIALFLFTEPYEDCTSVCTNEDIMSIDHRHNGKDPQKNLNINFKCKYWKEKCNKPQAIGSTHNEFPAGEEEPSLPEAEAIHSPYKGETKLVPPPLPKPTPPPLPQPSISADKSTTRHPTCPAITPPPPALTISAISSGSEVEPTYSSHLLEAEIPPQLLSRIRDRVKREYRGDSESQRSELENQMESYRALQEIVAQPPEGLDEQTLAKIVVRAQREYPLDLRMQLHEVELQIEGHAVVEHFSDGTNHTELPSEIINKIARRAKREHANNFSLQAYELKKQMSAYIEIAELRSSLQSDVGRKQMANVIAEAESKYPDNYFLQVYHIKQGFGDDAE